MKIKTKLLDRGGEVEAYFLFEKEKFPSEVKKLEKYSKQEKFKGKEGETFTFNDGNKKIIICGLGDKKEFILDDLRKAVALAFNYANGKKAKSLCIAPPKIKDLKGAFVVIGEAVTLSTYKFDQFKTKKKDDEEELTVKEILLKEGKRKELENALNEGVIKADAQNYASELSELPANVLTPLEFAKRSKEIAREKSLSIKVLDKKELKKKKMNALLAVSEGSSQPPVMIVLEYNKNKKNLPLYAIAGKGVTFDSGGLNLKPWGSMDFMKYDKTGACEVLAVMKGVAELKLPIRVTAIIPLTENMPGASAQKPGDIIKAYNGKTIEVLNTDAEGRLILADALAYAAEKKPKAIIDVATLTGAASVCLGKHAIALLTNDDALAKTVEKAGIYTHEKVWRLPLWKEYSEMMKGELADIKNIGSDEGEGGTITAAAFLKEFIGKTKWIHLDIAAVDHVKNHPYLGTRASGKGTRLVIEILKRLSKK